MGVDIHIHLQAKLCLKMVTPYYIKTVEFTVGFPAFLFECSNERLKEKHYVIRFFIDFYPYYHYPI